MSRFSRRLLHKWSLIAWLLLLFFWVGSFLFRNSPTASQQVARVWNVLIQFTIAAVGRVISDAFIFELIKSALVAAVILAVGSAWRRVPRSLERCRARLFWGRDVAGDGIAVCFGSLVDSRVFDHAASPFRYIKTYRDGRQISVVGPSEKLIGLCEVRAASYIINALSKYRPKPLPIEDDQSALKLLERSIICIGSAASNELTELIENDPHNSFLRFTQEDGTISVQCKITGKNVELPQSKARRDLGIILKIPNSRFPNNHFFVCAGLGEWGTSGAAWYLATHWKKLDDLGDEFGCVVEVEIGADQSARPIYI